MSTRRHVRRQPLRHRLLAAALDRLRRWLHLRVLLLYSRPLLKNPAIPADVLAEYTFRALDVPQQLVAADSSNPPAPRLT